MLEIREIVLKLDEEEYASFKKVLVSTRAEKTVRLLELLREPGSTDEAILNKLGINSTAYYTLRSRLNDKLQEWLLTKVKPPKLELLEKLNNIDYILYNYPFSQASSILKKLEDELLKLEQPVFLIRLYEALKRLYKGTANYYLYSQKYNEHVAWLLDYDKMFELVSDFIAQLGKYSLSRLPEDKEVLELIVDQVQEQAQVRESHRLVVFLTIAQASYQLFLDEEDQEKDFPPVEDLIEQLKAILNEHTQDVFYVYLSLLVDFLCFEYYHKYGIKKKEGEYYLLVQDHLQQLLGSYFNITLPSCFLLSKMERAIKTDTTEDLMEDRQVLQDVEIPAESTINHINVNLYLAVAHYYQEEYSQAIDLLNEVWTNTVFKSYPHYEIQLKLFMALNYALLREPELANSFLKSVNRKISTLSHFHYDNAKAFRKLVQAMLTPTSKDKEEKIRKLVRDFNNTNNDIHSILTFIKMDDAFIRRASRAK